MNQVVIKYQFLNKSIWIYISPLNVIHVIKASIKNERQNISLISFPFEIVVVLVTSKNVADLIKIEGARGVTTLKNDFPDAQGQLTL